MTKHTTETVKTGDLVWVEDAAGDCEAELVIRRDHYRLMIYWDWDTDGLAYRVLGRNEDHGWDDIESGPCDDFADGARQCLAATQ
jgi:hypothetical protein